MTETPGMDRERMDPRLLNAFADGALEPEDAARVVMHLADCPADQAVVDGIMTTNALLARACAGPMQEPVPPAIRATILDARPAEPRPRQTPPRRRPARAFLWAGALAAGLAAAALLPPLLTRDGAELALGPVPARSPLAEALTELHSGETQMLAQDVEIVMVATYASPAGFCREFTLHAGVGAADLAGLACRDGTGWRVAARETEPESEAGTRYVPAGGDDADAIRTSLDARDAGPALSTADEAAALGAGWR